MINPDEGVIGAIYRYLVSRALRHAGSEAKGI
jgi:hypothetical protein